MFRYFVVALALASPAFTSAFAIDWQDPRAVVAAAAQNQPALVRLQAQAEAARERAASAGALPNPMVMAGVQDKQVDLRDDEMMTMVMVGASQTFTRKAKRDARRESASLEATALERELDVVRAGIERDALLAWYELAAADSRTRAAEQVRQALEAVVAAARIRYEVGGAAQADVVRAQLQQSDLEQQLLALKGERRAALARLLPLLGLPLDTAVPSLAFPEATAAQTVGPAVVPDAHPAFAALEADIARAEEELRLARLLESPDVDVEASYGIRKTQTDVFSVVARIELPIRRDQTEPRVREAILLRDAARTRIDELRRELTRALGVAVAMHDESEEQLRFHRDVLVPQSKLAFESSLAAYQTGSASFDALLATESDYLRLQLRYYEFLLRHARAVAEYEALRRGARA
ncbi:MAG TPA: TolC family protein [Thermoanaerobaculia bacterium]|jgi:outer membrane protein TolC